MSSISKNVTNFRVVVGCKVCKDAGKPESEYTTHFVKDNEGKVICPTLLNLNCKYCQKPGHTISHCQILQSKNKANEKAKRREEFAAKKATRNQSILMDKRAQTKFGFEILDSDDDDEQEDFTSQKTSTTIEDFPYLYSDAMPIIPPVHAGGTTYAFMAAKTIEEFENEQFERKMKENSLKNMKITQTAEKKAPLKASELNWAMEESDSDDDW